MFEKLKKSKADMPGGNPGDSAKDTETFKALLDNLPCFAMVLKKKDRTIICSNEPAIKVGAVVGKTCYQTIAKRDDPCPFCKAPEVWETNESRRIDVEYNGSYYEGIWIPLSDEYYVHYIFDNTERKKAEEVLQESEKRYRYLFGNMLNGLAYCRMIFENGRPHDFIYLEVNKKFEILTGLKNVAGKKVTEIIPGIRETDPELFEIYGRVTQTNVPESFETHVKALDMWFSVSVYGAGSGCFIAVFDVITERKQLEKEAQKRLQELEVFYKSAMGREERIIELKKEIESLKKKAGR